MFCFIIFYMLEKNISRSYYIRAFERIMLCWYFDKLLSTLFNHENHQRLNLSHNIKIEFVLKKLNLIFIFLYLLSSLPYLYQF